MMGGDRIDFYFESTRSNLLVRVVAEIKGVSSKTHLEVFLGGGFVRRVLWCNGRQGLGGRESFDRCTTATPVGGGEFDVGKVSRAVQRLRRKSRLPIFTAPKTCSGDCSNDGIEEVGVSSPGGEGRPWCQKMG
ncbi:hypothetical protein TNCV_2709601 [Trichonephila clavipes]|nr:hypothetical protein TNCV_2709601 [Trichonephila clavipes]